MRTSFLLAGIVLFLLIVAPAARANSNSEWCAPEYGSCDDTGGGGTGGGTTGGGGGGTYIQGYGGDFAACSATGSQFCYRCEYSFKLKTKICIGVRYAGSCGCWEEYRNYILVNCLTRGSCDYY